MARWRYRGQNDEESEKTGRMRSRSKSAKTSREKLSGKFILAEKKWPTLDGGFAARVVEVHKRYAFVSREDEVGRIDTSDVWLARVARKYLTAERTTRNFVSVGDRVLCTPAEEREVEPSSDLPQCIVQTMAPRRSKISRVDPLYHGREHVLASNVDQLLVVASFLKPRVKWGLIDRYLVLAELQGVNPVIVLNKSDLLNIAEESEEFIAECHDRADYYAGLGYDTFVVQANREEWQESADFARLKGVMADKISMCSGHSGVGKSSVINLLDPEIVQEVEPDSEIFYKGRHTTTYASFIKLGIGGYVIDTPGIRSFVIQERTSIELSFGFREMRELSKKCQFRECRHIDEPDCAVIAAVADGSIPEWRYRNYSGILLGTTGREGRLRDAEKEQ